ncbi:SDR family NAD(P)-dependent oxidoreductase [Mycolicibacterium sp.]|jgi:NAD(P)-dependent dehydrogenase (short-subunit alcohol dehydrogenase family)|uniref:SDR family NAD(P)-dependent oxidoreductase n=1 Tax=Mycolicibacterium sp. TaxID=2320850 RepID=UPI001A1A1CE0|nr:SDR family NAD(P)-dependent oxidoreductase [Mycolicibacterium sp.]MBJ7398863.1 SDR family oxidoreductase [Mycolicibacterium sp.]
MTARLAGRAAIVTGASRGLGRATALALAAEGAAVATAAAPNAEWPGFLSVPVAAYRRHLEIGPLAAYELAQLICPDMIDAGRGSIINITSVASRVPGDGPYAGASGGVLPGYGGSKAALEHLTSCVAFDLQRHNIAVNALAPSRPIPTPGLSYYRSAFARASPDEEFARAVVELAMVDPRVVTGRTIGHLEVLDGTFRPFTDTAAAMGQVYRPK